MNGVAKVTVDFKAKTATIHAKNGTTIKRRAVARLLKKGGYGVTSFKAPQAATTTVYAIGVTGMR
jgi:hypothetical protein